MTIHGVKELESFSVGKHQQHPNLVRRSLLLLHSKVYDVCDD